MKFQTIRIEGNTISADILEKVSEGDYKGQLPKDFGFESSVKLKDEIARAWADAQNQWKIFRSRTSDLDQTDTGLPEVRKYWMIPFLGLLDYNLEPSSAEKLDNGNSYAISHRETKLDRFPVYIVGFKDTPQNAPEERSTLDIKPSNVTRRMSPHALVQEYVNLTEYTYAIITNGYQIRLLRDSSRLIKLSFLEFDLYQMMEEELFADFALLFRILHASRLPTSRQVTADSLIEQYHQDSIESGSRIREGLSEAVEKSIRLFANGFLKHPDNQILREAIINKEISADKYYQYQLRLIYRLLFLMVTEERNLVYPEQHDKKRRDIYYTYYSVDRLRRLVNKRYLIDGRFTDHWEGLKHTFHLFESEKYGGALGIKPLNGDLFGFNALGVLSQCTLDNGVLLNCIRNLTVFVNKNTHQLMRVNYASLNVEEFGSVYEGLLEYDPVLHINDVQPITFEFKTGEGRSSSGSHYTPEELVQPLIKHSLEYIIEDKLKEKDKEAALLSIKVCDVACGSGHILLSAARRIATDLAKVRTGEDQPSPGAIRVAIRDVIKNCIYGVDKNPLAVELCKVALWLESHNPGEPLGFLDHHIKCGDAIVGLAHREELENGIANEAFKTLPDDEKEIASSFVKQNKSERKERESKVTQLKAEFDASVQGNVQEAMEEYGNFIKLPESTPGEIETKQRAYHRFLQGKGYTFLKAMADTKLAQFFIAKTNSMKDKLVTDAEFRQILRGYKSWQSPKTAYAKVVAQEKRFFHWFIEFPEVFQQGGFNCVLGNPPFLGGSKISGYYSDAYLNALLTCYTETTGRCDLVGFFFRRIYGIINYGGFLSLISTNTVAQGDTKKSSLDVIVKLDGHLNFAIKSMKWPGKAAVEIALLSIHKGDFSRPKFVSNRIVKSINNHLEESTSSEVDPKQLFQNSGLSFEGVKLMGTGFILNEQDVFNLIQKDPQNKQVLYPYLNGDDLNSTFDQRATRWVINFFEWPQSKARQFTDCFRIVEEKVKPVRLKQNDQRAKTNWWIYQRPRPELGRAIRDKKNVIVIAKTSKSLAFELVPTNQVLNANLSIIVFDDFFHFAVLQSSLHAQWAWKYCTTMKTDLIYTPTTIFQSFPFPNNNALNQDSLVSTIGSELYTQRKNLLKLVKIGLTKFYNIFHSQHLSTIDIEKQSKQPREVCDQALQDIFRLRELHVQMDQAVLEAYGWQDIQLRHNFYEVDYLPENDRVRYTIHPEARKEILKRLLELNHKIHEEEVKAGLWDKKKSAKGKSKKKTNVVEETKGQYGLGL